MQSTEEYLDQLLASVSDDAEEEKVNSGNKSTKSIEDLEESELTEEALQQQLALLLGLETGPEALEAEDDFMAQYTDQIVSDFDDELIVAEQSDEVMETESMEVIPEVDSTSTVSIEESTIEEPVKPEETVVPEISSTGVLSADEIAALFASMENEESETESVQEDVVDVVQEVSKEEEAATPTPEISSTGVLSADEIAALFASMENEEPETESAQEDIVDEVQEVVKEEEASVPAPENSNTGVLSADEIAALFASMEADESVEEENVQKETEAIVNEPMDSDGSGLTREELEELGLGDIADILVETETLEENVQEENSQEKIVEIDDLGFDEEMLLDIDNIDAMLEATAKLAVEEQQEETETKEEQIEEDIMSMLAQFEEESVQESKANEVESLKAAEEAVNQALETESNAKESTEEPENGKKKKVKKQKVKKEKAPKEPKDKSNKPSLKEKLFAFMFEEDNLDETENGTVSDENGETEALSDIKPAKEKKSKAAKKEKKNKKEANKEKAKDENAAIEAELAEEDKKSKKKEKVKKEKKAKKVVFAEKTPEEERAERIEAKRAIGTKGIVATLLVCASILGLILVGTYFLPKQLSLMAARVAFYAQDYEEAAMRLKGQKLNESDQIMYEKAMLLYGLEERYHQYEVYTQRGLTKEALDALLQGVIACNKEEILANQLGIDTEWRVIKQQFVNALQNQFGLDYITIEAVCELRNPNYTVAVENILAGRDYNDMTTYGGTLAESETESLDTPDTTPEENPGGLNPEELEDLLPEEQELLEQLQQEAMQEEAESTEDSNQGDKEIYSGSVEGGSVNFVE